MVYPKRGKLIFSVVASIRLGIVHPFETKAIKFSTYPTSKAHIDFIGKFNRIPININM